MPSENSNGGQTTEAVRVEFIGRTAGSQTYGGRGVTPSGTRYRGGLGELRRFADAAPADVAWLEGTGDWKRVPPKAAPVEPVSENDLESLVSEMMEDEPESTLPEIPAPDPEAGTVIVLPRKKRKYTRRA